MGDFQQYVLSPPPRSICGGVTLVVLLFFFGMRFIKSKKFMPMGMMALLSVVTLALRQLSQ